MGSVCRPHRARGGLACTAVASVALVVGLAGCGSSSESTGSKSAEAILAATQKAAGEAMSVHVQSRASVGPVTLSTDLLLAANGGHSSLSLQKLGYETIRIGNTLYVKGTSPLIYRQLAVRAGVHVPTGTWLKGSTTTGPLARFAGSTDKSSKLTILLTPSGTVTKGPETVVNGKKVVELNEKGKLFTGSIYVAATGQPYPVEIVKHGRESGQTTFSEWNQPVSLVAPSNAVEVEQLPHG